MNRVILLMLGFFTCAQVANAALITSTVTSGNSVTEGRFNDFGTTRLTVDFSNFSSVQINLDNDYLDQDDVFLLINNNTGSGWSGFNFELVGVGFFGPLSLTTQTGTFVDWNPYGSDSITGLNTGADVGFNPFEYVGFSATGNIDTTFVGGYSLILTPATVPVPTAVWLFVSGILGLIGVAKNKP